MYTTPDGALHIPLRFGKFFRHWFRNRDLVQGEIILPAGAFTLLPAFDAGIVILLLDPTVKASLGDVDNIRISPDGVIELHKNTNTVWMD